MQTPGRECIIVEPRPLTFVEIPAIRTMVIRSFLSSEETREYGASELFDFFRRKIPYSHLGSWRSFVDPKLIGVDTIKNSPTYATCHITVSRRAEFSQKIEHPTAFIADPPSGPALTKEHQTIGIAPSTSQTGDVVFTFLDSLVALMMRPTTVSGRMSTTVKDYETLDAGKYTLVGCAAIQPSCQEMTSHFKSRLNSDKSVKTTIARPFHGNSQELPCPATLSIDTPTLQFLTRTGSNPLPWGFSKPLLELLPSRDLNAETMSGHLDSTHNLGMDEFELKMLQRNPELIQRALAHGYAGITNLGSTGYFSATLQIFYMLKPLRTVFFFFALNYGVVIVSRQSFS